MRGAGPLLLISIALATLAFHGCGRKESPEKTLIGTWVLDKEGTQKSNPILAAVPGGIIYEFNPDGTGAEGIGGPGKKCKWEIMAKEGDSYTIQVTPEAGKNTSTIIVTVVDHDRIKVKYPKGLGECQLSRVTSETGSPTQAGSPQVTLTPRASVDTGTKQGVDGVALSGDGHILIAISNHIVKVWEVPAGKELWHFKDEHGAGLARVAISPDGKTAAHASHASITLHDAGTGKQLHRLFHKGLVSGLCFSPEGNLVVAGGQTVITGFDPKSGKERFVWGPEKKRGQWITALSEFFNAGGQIASGSEDGTIKVWDIAAGKPLKILASGKRAKVEAIAASADGNRLAAIKYLNFIEVWDVRSGQLANSLQRKTGIFPRCFFLADGKTLVYPGSGNRICVDRIDVGQERCQLEGHSNPVWSLGLAADGSTLASGDRDGIIKIWDLKSLP